MKKIFIRSISSSCSNVSNRMHQQSCRVKTTAAPAETKAEETTAAEASSEGERRKQQLTEI